MKLYIPTSSLNADSILSCECVAPATICRARNFGYQHFELLPELQHFDNITLAFSKVPIFYINDQLRENHPMVVEIEVNEEEFNKINIVKLDNVKGVDIYASANPILITPTNTRLLFFKREHLDYSIHNCSDSAKCKLFDFFNKHFSYVPRDVMADDLGFYIAVIQPPHIQPTYSENDYNRVKGFIWGFGLGTFVSMTPEIARLLKIQKRIYDIISSAKNDGYITQTLKIELESLDKEFTRLDPEQVKAKTLWKEYLKNICERFDIKADDISAAINKVLVSLKVENEAKTKFLAENNIRLRKPMSSYPMGSMFGYEQFCADLERHTHHAIHRNRQECLNSNIFDSLDIDTEKYETVVLSGDDKDSILFNRFLFKVIWSNLIPSLEDLRVNRSESAKQVVIALKSIIEGMGDAWTETPIQVYFDRMRKNISKFDPFNPTDEDSAVLQSISSFILKGEDFESLKSYLETNAISNYRYAFALWGAMTGYVSISRSTIEVVLKTKSNIARLYNYIEAALDNICPNLSHNNAPVEPSSQNLIESQISQICKNPKELLPPSVQDFRNLVLRVFETKVARIKGMKNDRLELLREGLLKALEEFGNDTNPVKFVSLLNDFTSFKWNPVQKPWKIMQETLAPEYSDKTSRIKIKRKDNITSSQAIIPGFEDNVQIDMTAENNRRCNSGGWSGAFKRIFGGVSNIPDVSIKKETNKSKISFTRQYIKEIRELISTLNPGLDNFALTQIEKDLNWVFDPNYSAGKTEIDLINLLKSILTSAKTENVSKNGKSMEWKNKAYLPLDVDRTIHYLKIISGNE